MTLIQPEFLQTKSYSALRDRLAFQHGGPIQPGVWDAGDFKVTQKAAGANLSVDVAAGYALVPANDPSNAGYYHSQNDASVNVAGAAVGHATLPRIDQVILTINDTTHGGDASDTPTMSTLIGTATSGATLDNRTGAAALPNGSIRLADVLMPAASTTMTTANIRDRRAWARGAFSRINRNANAAAGNDYTTTSTSSVAIDATNLSMRIECSGVPLRVKLNTSIQNATAATVNYLQVAVDGTPPDGGTDGFIWVEPTINYPTPLNLEWTFIPAVGSHLIVPTWKVGSGTALLFARSTFPLVFTVEELVRQNANNT
jgi:hypothetical protein